MDAINVRLDRMHTYQRIADHKITLMRDNIASALPHELRTPLNTILGFSDLLMLDTPNLEPAQVLEWADHINQAGMRLYRLIENYLMYVRIETISRDAARATTLQQKRTVDAAMIIELQAMTRAEQAHRDADLVIEMAKCDSLVMSEQDLTKAIDELLDNAFKFSKPGQTVTVRGEIQNEHYLVHISDYGRGMTNEQIKQVGAFMQFERWLHEQQGTGLGLIVARGLVELYGGTLHLVSTPQVGTTATMTLLIDKQ
ncbi:MAG: HAMP domain-containing histidine kinase [Armatimonadetes bacterium]|nr:HAMP domain-containing histidine kinase [Anaerolineae bacterium]